MKVFLDDVRDCPDGWVLCRTAEEAIDMIRTGDVTKISFDHDLGTELTGYDVAKEIEYLVANGEIKDVPEWYIHSQNPVGARNIMMAMIGAEKLFTKGLMLCLMS
jgi:hypothetical protein